MAKVYLCFLFAALIIAINATTGNLCSWNETKIPIHIRSIMTFESEFESGEHALFLQAAADHMNSIDGILDRYHICFRWDHATDTSHALSILYDYIYNGPPIPMMFGPPYSSVSALLNPVAGQFNIVQITSASSPAISDRDRFPLTVQTYPIENDMNPGRVGFIKLMKWKRVAIVFHDIEYFRENMNDLIRRLEDANINILTVEAVSDTSNPDQHIQSLLIHDARIIILAVYEHAALIFACQLHSKDQEEFWTLNNAYNIIATNTKRTYYDSMVLMAMALNASIGDLKLLNPPRKLEDFEYTHDDMRKVFNYNVRHAEFISISGPTRINITRDRQGLQLYISQYRDKRGDLILYFDIYGENPVWVQTEEGNASIIWSGNRAPVDGKTYLLKYVLVEETSRIIIFILTTIGICFSLFFMFINIRYKNERAIKMTSPALNNFIIIGGLLLYASIFAYGIDHSNMDDTGVAALCYVQFACVSTGFTFAMGALFMKTYRVHTIFKKARKAIKVEIRDIELLRWLMGLVALDILLLVLWILLDMIYITDIELQPQLDMTEPYLEIYTVPLLRQCNSDYQVIFLSALAVTKTILLTFGVFLAWKTRNVTISALNDSKYIAACVYIIALVIVLLIPAFSVTSKDVNGQFILTGSAVIVTMTTVLFLLFVPKILIFWKYRNGSDVKISTMASSNNNNTSSSLADNEASLASILAKVSTLCEEASNPQYAEGDKEQEQ
ncbi:gamma-aminobutyric acid type B receptor subunit 2-like [Amphiura filiformis]|uniref:gamma-aminobutyric acid type B receptor subunit 2-like n=1 Tax=Amphiura filiformis TaxID=82378 RepID=UPI003B211B2A